MKDVEIFAAGIILGTVSSACSSLAEAQHIYENDRGNFHLVIIPYVVIILLAIYILAGAKNK